MFDHPAISSQEHPTHLKRCSRCKQDKPLTDFVRRKRRNGKIGVTSQCKQCHAKTSLEWVAANRTTRNEALRKYNRSDKRKAVSRKYGGPRADERLLTTRSRRLKMYGFSDQDYDRLLNEQGGVCAACGRAETRKHPSGRICSLSLDHDHATGAPRGLLCHGCNVALGWLKEDPAIIQGLMDYIRKWPSRVVAGA